jgi:hypothetical protein
VSGRTAHLLLAATILLGGCDGYTPAKFSGDGSVSAPRPGSWVLTLPPTRIDAASFGDQRYQFIGAPPMESGTFTIELDRPLAEASSMLNGGNLDVVVTIGPRDQDIIWVGNGEVGSKWVWTQAGDRARLTIPSARPLKLSPQVRYTISFNYVRPQTPGVGTLNATPVISSN